MVMVGEACRTDAEKGCQQVLKCSPIFAKRQHVRGECYGCERGRGLSISHFIRFRKISSYLKRKWEKNSASRSTVCDSVSPAQAWEVFFLFSALSYAFVHVCLCYVHVLGEEKITYLAVGQGAFLSEYNWFAKELYRWSIFFSQHLSRHMRQAVPLFRVRMSQDSKNKFRKRKSLVELLHPNDEVFILTGIVRVSGDLKQAAEARDLFFNRSAFFFLGPQGICVWTQTEPGLIHPAIHWSSSDFKSLKGFVPKHEISNAVVKQQHRQRPVIKLAPHC